MALGKQAKILSKAQIDTTLRYISSTRDSTRNRAIFLLSVRAGLRAKEIAALTWPMITDAEGKLTDAIHLIDDASKGRSGRIVPLSKDLRLALAELRGEGGARRSPYVITTQRSQRMAAGAMVNLFAGWYRALGFEGASSHSGRRTAITSWARKITTVGGSLRDVQMLAGHSALTTTQRYIESDVLAQRRVVEM